MILTCPECATRYFVDDGKLPSGGRTVRCAACKASWRATAEEPLELTVDGEEGAIARAPAATEPKTFRTDPADLPATELPKAFRAETERKKRMRRAAVAGILWGGVGAAFLALFAGAYLFRQNVVDLAPQAAGAYAAVGVDVNAVGLAFEGVKAEPTLMNGAPVVKVTGTLRNVTSKDRTSPPLKVALLDKAGKPIATETVLPPAGPVAPGEGRLFKAVLADPQSTAADVGVDFLFEGKGPRRAHHKKGEGGSHASKGGGDGAAALRPAVGLEPVDAQPVEEAANPLDSQVAEAVSASSHGDAHH
jgi:predicted Zn finger-like uncharacterized protein